MDIIIQSLGFKASDALESYIREHVQKIKGDKIIRADVTLYKGSEGNPNNSVCEIRLEVPGNDPFVKKGAESFEAAVAGAVEILQKVSQREKDKAIARRQADKESFNVEAEEEEIEI